MKKQEIAGYFEMTEEATVDHAQKFQTEVIEGKTVFPYYKMQVSPYTKVYLMFKKKRKYIKKKHNIQNTTTLSELAS
jgi:hypothetical protein